MKEWPILFSGPMALANIEGRKTVTRRISKRWLKVKTGDLLWQREFIRFEDNSHAGFRWLYAADEKECVTPFEGALRYKSYPSIHMPRWACRLTMRATEDAREERLQDITEEEARREGISVLPLQSADDHSAWWQSSPGIHQDRTARGSFIQLWSSLPTKPGERWEDNPAVVRIAYEVVDK